jgi:hypothetical protein
MTLWKQGASAVRVLARLRIFRPQDPRDWPHFVTSMTAPIASGWSGCWVGLAPIGKAPPFHGAHPNQTFSQIGTRD